MDSVNHKIERDFSKISVSNVVGLFTLSNKFNAYTVFRLCTLYKIGNITGLDYQNFHRGAINVKSANCKKHWKNAIGIKMNKNLSCKLSDETLHLTGLKSKQQAYECFQELKDNLAEVEDNIKYMNDNIEMAKLCVNCIKVLLKGEEIYVIKNSSIRVNCEDVVIYKCNLYLNISSKLYKKLYQSQHLIPDGCYDSKMVYSNTNGKIEYPLLELKKFTTIKQDKIQIPIELDSRLINFFLDKVADFTSYNDYVLNLDWFLTIRSVFASGDKLEEMGFKYGNNNYNYNLGFAVNLDCINSLFNKVDGFVCEYFKDISKFAKVSIPMEVPEHLISQIRKGENAKCPKFIIYNSGSITQAGPHPEINMIAYSKFINVILNNLDFIIQKS